MLVISRLYFSPSALMRVVEKEIYFAEFARSYLLLFFMKQFEIHTQNWLYDNRIFQKEKNMPEWSFKGYGNQYVGKCLSLFQTAVMQRLMRSYQELLRCSLVMLKCLLMCSIILNYACLHFTDQVNLHAKIYSTVYFSIHLLVSIHFIACHIEL